MKLIVGLGNPGKKYDLTRHNVGFMFLDYFANEHNIVFTEKNKSLIAEFNYNGEKIILLKPQTFMNLSGEAVIEIVRFYKLKIEDIIIIYDDLDMEFGKMRIKDSSSSGGHNGIKNIINHLGTQDFMRIKIGINNPNKRDVKTFVLSRFSKDELGQLDQILNKVSSACDYFINEDSIEQMRKTLLN